MLRFSTLAALLLVALWLPATLHCQLEAAGLFKSDECCQGEPVAETGASCKDDACTMVEEALYKESSSVFPVSAPSESGCATGLALAVTSWERGVEPDLSPARHAPPMELKVAWQFLARAARPARAPSRDS